MIRFNGEVVVITGAGRGLGRAHALHLARLGARVVVNDLGTSMTGHGTDTGPAQAVVQEIVEAGGIAMADTHDITDAAQAAAIVGAAVDAFGRLDAVINNAGIYGTDSFPDVDAATLQRHLAVHVVGAFNLTRAAWPHLQQAPAGRVVFTTSHGALGAADLVAYGTAKAALWGLTRALAQTAQGTPVRVNAIAPNGITRMAISGIDQDQAGSAEMIASPAFGPELVSPTVALLAHESCPSNGEIIAVGMRRHARLFLSETRGYLHPSIEFGAEEVLANWDAITSPEGSRSLANHPAWLEFSNAQLQQA